MDSCVLIAGEKSLSLDVTAGEPDEGRSLFGQVGESGEPLI